MIIEVKQVDVNGLLDWDRVNDNVIYVIEDKTAIIMCVFLTRV